MHKRFIQAYERFVKIRGHPREIALGFALGLFIALTPTMGLQMMMAFFLAAVFKWNKLSALVGVWITNPFTAPFIYTATYISGARLLRIKQTILPSGEWDLSLLIELIKKTPELIAALTLGGVVIGIPVAVAGYYVAFMAVDKYQSDLKERLTKHKRLQRKRRKQEKRKQAQQAASAYKFKRYKRKRLSARGPKSNGMQKNLTKTSKFLSYVLRHKPEAIGLALDQNGWASVDELIQQARTHGRTIDQRLIAEVVATNDKQRFSLSEDGRRIRARQGHSIDIALGLEPQAPPRILFHGTATRFLDSILKAGLKPKGRQHVHLSPDITTALKVGQRHGKPIVIQVQADAMHRDGLRFYLSENGVWLTGPVPAQFLTLIDEKKI